MKQALAFLAMLAPFALVSCTAPRDGSHEDEFDEEEDVGEVELKGTGGNPNTGHNHNSGLYHWQPDTQQAYRVMGDTALDDGYGYLPVLDIDPLYRNEVIANAVECGLGVGDFVTDPLTGDVFEGHFGLDLAWKGNKLSPEGRRWVTGCMAQRLNAWGFTVPILLVGNTAPIYYHKNDNSAYPWNESTVWGDLFSSTEPLGTKIPPYPIYVCSDAEQIDSCDGDQILEWFDSRICDGADACGLTYLGPCSNPVCMQVSGPMGTYPQCWTPSGELYEETVHVQIHEQDGTCTAAP
jgi:hypothetical protein